MLLALGAASAALDAIKSLTSSNPSSSQSAGFGPTSADPFDIAAAPSGSSTAVSGFSGGARISPATMSALLAAQSQSSTGSATPVSASPASALQNLFSQIDANGDGQITKSEFENALGAGGTNIAQADHVFNKLDKNGDGTVSLGELSSALQGSGAKGGHHGHHPAGGSDDSIDPSSTSGLSADPLLQSLQAAFSTSTPNGNGLTASLTPADLSNVKVTSLAALGSATTSYNLTEQLIQREANAASFSVPSLSFSA
jgi:hypothetical protein